MERFGPKGRSSFYDGKMLILAPMLLALAQSVALGQKVTLTMPATPVATALVRLAAEYHVALYADASVKGEMVVLRFKDVPLQAAMDKIADVTTAAWVKTDLGYELVRTGAIIRSLEEKVREERTAKLKKILDKRATGLFAFNERTAATLLGLLSPPAGDMTNGADWNTASGRAMKASCQEPQSRFVTRLALAIGPDVLAGLESRRTVFSTLPSQRQRPLPRETMALVAEFVRDQKVWHKVATPDDSEPNLGRYLVSDWNSWPMIATDDVTGVPANCVLIVTPSWAYDRCRVSFRILNDKGESIVGGESDLSEDFGGRVRLMLAGGDDAEPPSSGEDVPEVPLSKPAKELAKLSGDGTDVVKERNAPKELAPFFIHPERNEPLALFPSEPILGSPEAANLNVAACVDDSAFSALLGAPDGVPLKQALAQSEVGSGGGWLTVKPKRPLDGEHVARTSIGRFFQAALRDGRLTIEASAEYATAAAQPLFSILFGLDTQLYAMAGSSDDWDFLRLYGSLDLSTQARLCGGNSLSVGGMTPAQKKIVEDIVYNSHADNFQEENASGDVVYGLPATGSFFADEPTYFLAKGLDPAITLQVQPEVAAVLFVTTKGEDGAPNSEQEEDLDQVAAALFEAQSPKDKSDTDETPMVTLGYRIGVRRTLSLKLRLPGNHLAEGDLSDVVEQSGPLLQLADLPVAIQNGLRERMEKMRKERQDEGGDPPPQPSGISSAR